MPQIWGGLYRRVPGDGRLFALCRQFRCGAETPAAGAYTAVGLAIAALALTPLIYFLPKATLAATIIVAVLSLVDLSILKRHGPIPAPISRPCSRPLS